MLTPSKNPNNHVDPIITLAGIGTFSPIGPSKTRQRWGSTQETRAQGGVCLEWKGMVDLKKPCECIFFFSDFSFMALPYVRLYMQVCIMD